MRRPAHNEDYYLRKARSARTYKSKSRWYALAGRARAYEKNKKCTYVKHSWRNEQNAGSEVVGFEDRHSANQYIKRISRTKPFGNDKLRILKASEVRKLRARDIRWR